MVFSLRILMSAAVTASTLFTCEPIHAVDAEVKAQHTSGLRHVADYPLPGRATRWDYMSFDPVRSLLFIAHLGDSEVVVFNTRTNTVVGTVKGVGAVHGTLALPSLGRVYATATSMNEVVVIDEASLEVLARVPAGVYPDGLADAPDVFKLYVSDEQGKTETVISTQTNQRVTTIQLGGEVGNTQYDPGSKHIFVNVQDIGALVEIDPNTDRIVARIRVGGGVGNHGLLVEPRLRLAFIANEHTNKLLVLDLRTRKTVAAFPLADGPDVLAYDNKLGVLYVASESGVVSKFKVSEQGVRNAGESVIGANAHTVAVDPSTHAIYLPLKEAGKPPVLRVMLPAF